jgi:hypothetical protein
MMPSGDGLADPETIASAAGDTLTNTYYKSPGETTNYGDRALPNMPGPAGPFAKLVIDGKAAAKSGNGFDVTTVTADAATFITSCGTTALSVAADPLGWLINQGLGFLINVCTPLKEAIDLVSGNPDALRAAAAHFSDIGKDLEKFSSDLVTEAQQQLKDWEGDAATAAAAKIGEFAEGVLGTAGEAGNVATILQLSSMLCQVIEDFIKGLLAELVEWLIVTWLAALATAPVTFGGSTAAASAVTEVKAAETTVEATEKVGKFTKLLNKIKEILAKLQEFLTKSKIADKFWAEGGKGGKALDKPFGKALGDATKGGAKRAFGLDETNLQGAGAGGGDIKYTDPAKIAGKIGFYGKSVDNAVTYDGVGEDQSSEQIEHELDF